ncbi:MAG: hypothetical protein WAQ53_03315 [Thiofilum sp.]|uniref:hypothetical protein n=1 Tax=Thiofilum sp. TaxID=2212733 RepID=UPI0025DD8683|nr:hypothetical protein [Thiofilum sp.]MBK8454720.1 hypothetical protein [Thiofilum sp.]
MFELEKQSVFFEKFSEEYSTILQNIEIIHENKLQLEFSYHHPKHFILNLNNLLRSLLFFVESSLKNSPQWLSAAVKEFKKDNSKDFQILKYLRNVSAHQKFILPEESIVTGLYRIRSDKKYILKLGFGDFNKPGKYSWDLSLKNTEDIFHDILVFDSLVFMDLEHSAFGECLGVTRRWFYKVKFKNEQFDVNEIVDVYKTSCTFSSQLLDKVVTAYGKLYNIDYDKKFYHESSEFNNINTLLELDLYPSLFSSWWKNKIYPLNVGVRFNINNCYRYDLQDKYHTETYKSLCTNEEEYKELLIKYSTMPTDDIFNSANAGEFCSFVELNHWFYKKAFKSSFGDTPLEPADIMRLQRYGKIFIEEFNKKKSCTVESTGSQFQLHLKELIKKI